MVVESRAKIRTRLSEFINLKMFSSGRGLSSQERREVNTIQTIEVKPRPILSPDSEQTFGTNASTAKLIKDSSNATLEGIERTVRKNDSFLSEDLDNSDDGGEEESERGEWDNPVEFLLSCLSFAVGLGNIWRFPYLCYRNGGGAFLIPYILSLIFMGLPVFLFEMGAGQFSSEGPIGLWKICPLFQGIGYGMAMLSMYIGTYYNIILSWAFFYIFSSFSSSLPWSTCDNWWNTHACRRFDSKNCTTNGGIMLTEDDCVFSKDVTVDVWRNLTEKAKNVKMPSDEFFHNFMLDISDGIHDMGDIRWELAGCLLLAWVVVYCALWKGIKSIGKLVYFTALFPYVILVILLVRAATLPGYVNGITFYLTPQWEKLTEINVWADACIQIFFSLGVTWGGMITLASYNKFRNNVFRDAVMVAMGNCVTSVFAGFVIFGIIGFMAHELGVEVKDVAAQGAGLAFIAYPEAVSRMPISPLWSVLFFMMLLSLGFGTQFSTTETVITILTDQFPQLRGKNRRWCTLCVCGVMFLMGLSMVTDAGMYILQLFDNHSATYSALIIGCAEVTVMAWVYGADQFLEDLKFMLGFYPFPYFFWKWGWKIISPSIVVCILVFTALDYSGNKYADYHYPDWANYIGWLITFSSVMLIPLVAVVQVAREEGPLLDRIKKLLKPSPEWGPTGPDHREFNKAKSYDSKFKVKIRKDIEGSNTTLLTNSSQNNINASDLKDYNCGNLETVSEAYEDIYESSEDEGISMKRVLDEKCEVIINSETSVKNKAAR